MSYEQYLEPVLGHGFEYRELVKPWRRDWRGRFRLPPEELWPRMLLTMDVANQLRAKWIAIGGAGLRVAAAYRPRGGARQSQHKVNAALDLDLLRTDYDKTQRWYGLAAEFWHQWGNAYDLGLGLYCRPERSGGIRVHIDTGHHRRTWQQYRGRWGAIVYHRPPLGATK
jgi:hypothetical protein